MTGVVPAVPVGAAEHPDAARRDAAQQDAGERGSTSVSDRVVAKVAAQAATEIDHAEGLRRSIAGRAVGSPRVRAAARVDGQVATLSLDLAIDYPSPVRQVTRAVRRHVAERVVTLCGMQVDHVDITVAALRRAPVETRRVR